MTRSATRDAIDVYWRPGCPYCTNLRRALERRHVPVRWHNIWADAADLARVRAATGGVDTVPTVFVGDVVMVNPTVAGLFELLAEKTPQLLGDGATTRAWPPLRIAQWAVTAVLVVASFTLDGTGHTAASWGVDPVAVLAWFGLGWAWRRGTAGSQ